MTPHIDLQEPVRRFEQPEPRFGAGHVPRNEIPAKNPEVLDFMEHQEAAEAATTAKYDSRKGAIAVSDTVSVNIGRSNSYETPSGLYL